MTTTTFPFEFFKRGTGDYVIRRVPHGESGFQVEVMAGGDGIWIVLKDIGNTRGVKKPIDYTISAVISHPGFVDRLRGVTSRDLLIRKVTDFVRVCDELNADVKKKKSNQTDNEKILAELVDPQVTES